MDRSLRDHLAQCKSCRDDLWAVYGGVWGAGRLPVCFTTIIALCESKQNSGDGSWGTTALAAAR